MMQNNRSRTYTRRGVLFVTSLVVLTVLLVVGTSFMAVSLNQLHGARREHNALQALAAADAGVNYMVWTQKHSNHPYPLNGKLILPGSTDAYALNSATERNCLEPDLGVGQAQNAVWLLGYSTTFNGKTISSYQAISKGTYRGYTRTVRAVLQPPPASIPTSIAKFPQLNYVVYTESDLYIDTSTNVHGNVSMGLGTNGSAYLSTSGGGSIDGHVYAAGAVVLDKNSTTINGNVQYGTKVLDPKGKDISGSTGTAITGTLTKGATTQLMPEMKSDEYYTWAQSQGFYAFFTDTKLTTADVIHTPILYVNPAKTPGYTMEINCNIPKPVTIFVNGDVTIGGNTTLGVNNVDPSQRKPFVLIATGTITLKGASTINGVVWAKGAFGRGTPNVNGTVLCNNMAGFQGNPQLTYTRYPSASVLPPSSLDYEHAWRAASWEEM